MSGPHLHQKIGDAVRECKRRMFDRLNDGADLEDATAQFIGELRLALEIVIRENKDVYEAPTTV